MQVNISGMSVAVGMPCYGDIPRPTVMSLVKTASFAAANKIRLDLIMEGAPLPLSRDFVLDAFLKHDCDKLLWIDSDMVWEPKDFAMMLAYSTVADVVCATYPAKVEKPTYYFRLPEIAKAGPNGLIECLGAGLGFTIVSRKVCQELADKAPLVRDPIQDKTLKSVFRFDATDGVMRTEDFAFFSDIRDLGHTVWLCPSIELGHVGRKTWKAKAEEILQFEEKQDA